MASFESVRVLLERYYDALLHTDDVTDRGQQLLQEVRGRLRQLQWSHSRLLQIETQLVQESYVETSESVRKLLVFTDVGLPKHDAEAQDLMTPGLSDELRVLLEAFYYSAHRVRDIFKDNQRDLPGLKTFEAIGVRDVRNHLVEHPTRNSGVITSSIKCGGPIGPQLKPLRFAKDLQGTVDAGLHKNAGEFLTNLERTLTVGVAQLKTT